MDHAIGQEKERSKIFVIALIVWITASLLRFWNINSYAGLTYDDAAYATSGRDLLLTGGGYWGDTLRPFATWFVAGFHWLNGISIKNIAIAFAFIRSLGELFLILAARTLFYNYPWAPLWAVSLSCASFLGVNYGKQHLASLLCSIPLSLWLYGRYLEKETMYRWLLCATASGFVFLSHYNTIAALVIMLGLDLIRLKFDGAKLPRILLIGTSGIATSFVTVMIFGKLSYGLSNWISYIKRVWFQILQNQNKASPQISDGFLSALISWEGIAFLLYFSALIWWLIRVVKIPAERKLLALPGLLLLGGALVLLRINLGYVSFPRLYVFALPFAWLLTAGFLASWTSTILQKQSTTRQCVIASGVASMALLISASHHALACRFSSPNVAIETYLRAHPTWKMIAWDGNPHLITFWVGRAWCPIFQTEAEAKVHWEFMSKGEKFSKHIPKRLLQQDHAVYLQRHNLSKICDIIILESPSIESLQKVDCSIRQQVPHAIAINFYNGSVWNFPISLEGGGALHTQPSFSEIDPLPFVRLYDLRRQTLSPLSSVNHEGS